MSLSSLAASTAARWFDRFPQYSLCCIGDIDTEILYVFFQRWRCLAGNVKEESEEEKASVFVIEHGSHLLLLAAKRDQGRSFSPR